MYVSNDLNHLFFFLRSARDDQCKRTFSVGVGQRDLGQGKRNAGAPGGSNYVALVVFDSGERLI